MTPAQRLFETYHRALGDHNRQWHQETYKTREAWEIVADETYGQLVRSYSRVFDSSTSAGYLAVSAHLAMSFSSAKQICDHYLRLMLGAVLDSSDTISSSGDRLKDEE